MVEPRISHDRGEESDDAKAVWFQSLTLDERMALLVEFSELVLQNQPRAWQTAAGRVRDFEDVRPIDHRLKS